MSEQNGDTMTEPNREIQPLPPSRKKIFSIEPKDLTEQIKLSELFAGSDLVPKDYKGKPGNCLIAMQYGAELGIPAFQAVQNIAVINGKPGIYGDLGKALLQSHRFKIEERDMKETKQLNEAWCRVTRPDNGLVIERTFSFDDAKVAKLWGKEGPWTTYPYRQMAWRAFWFAARDAAADVLKGMWGVEELGDMQPIDAEIVQEPKRLSESQEPNPLEPTPAQPIVDAKPLTESFIGPEERKHIIALCQEHEVNLNGLAMYLEETYGISDKHPTSKIKKTDYEKVCKWIAFPQSEIGFGG